MQRGRRRKSALKLFLFCPLNWEDELFNKYTRNFVHNEKRKEDRFRGRKGYTSEK